LHAQDVQQTGHLGEILLDGNPHFLAPEPGRGVHDWKNVPAVDRAQTSSDTADGLPGEESGHGEATQSDYQQWVDEFDLPIQEFTTCGYFARSRIPVVRGPALDHVGDVYLISGHADGLE
jgi:hypothetical protein